MKRQLKSALNLLRERGVRHTILRASEKYHEWLLGIHTEGNGHLPDFGFSNPDLMDYMPVPYHIFRRVLRYIDIRPDRDVFLDLGCGMGRPVVLAATHPFKRVIGVELVEHLFRQTLSNLAAVKNRLRCVSLNVWFGDATEYEIPPDVNVFHMYNPFRGEVMAKVIRNIESSLRQHPREAKILVGNQGFFEKENTVFKKVKQLSFFPNVGYAIYELPGL